MVCVCVFSNGWEIFFHHFVAKPRLGFFLNSSMKCGEILGISSQAVRLEARIPIFLWTKKSSLFSQRFCCFWRIPSCSVGAISVDVWTCGHHLHALRVALVASHLIRGRQEQNLYIEMSNSTPQKYTTVIDWLIGSLQCCFLQWPPFDIWGWSWIPPKNTLTSPEVGGQVTQSSPEERRSVEGTRQLWWSIGIEHVRSRDAESGPGSRWWGGGCWVWICF